MKKLLPLVLIGSLFWNVFLVYKTVDYSNRIISLQKITAPLEKKVKQLTALKKHFYDFRERVYKGIPLDYLSNVTLEDFNFKKYEAD